MEVQPLSATAWRESVCVAGVGCSASLCRWTWCVGVASSLPCACPVCSRVPGVYHCGVELRHSGLAPGSPAFALVVCSSLFSDLVGALWRKCGDHFLFIP